MFTDAAISRLYTKTITILMALQRAFVVFLSFFYSSEAFLSSAPLELDSETALNTRDHAIITKVGLLQSMVEFLQENPQYIDHEKDASAGDFSGFLISADNPTQLQKLFSLITSRIRLQNVIAEMQSSNAEMNSAPLKNVAAAHFSGEQFKEGSKRLLELKAAIVTTLLKGVKFEHARQLAGQYLHTLQDFYSHSNWVELGNQDRVYDVLTNGGNSIPSEFIAKPNEDTCIPCSLSMPPNDSCDNNLITEKITSGYHEGQDISNPANTSKCSHGGILDSSGDKVTRGGINKDTAARQWSPHYRLHAVAADLAIKATKQFFEDIRSAVGDDMFARLLNLQAVRTLALVIDDTGSMGEEIKSVKKLSTNFVQGSNITALNTGFVYILVPFNDPEVGPITVTSNPDEVIEAVNSLKAHGGLDCPELGMTGLYQALLQSVQDSVIHYFSDADAKDSNLAPVVLILAKQKKVILNFILSGHCSYKRKRRSGRDNIQLGSQNLYKSLAASTGGQMLMTQKSEVSVVVDIIGSGGDTNHLIQVILLHVSSDSNEEVQDVPYMVYVDDTLDDIRIVLSAEGNPGISLINPSDNQPLKVKMSQFNRVHVSEVGSFEGGPLEIRVRCTGPYSLRVTGRSGLDFSYQLSSVQNPETGETKRLLGSPIKGQTLLINMAFTKPELLNEATSLSLVDLSGRVMESFPVERGKGMYGGSYYVLFTPSAERFRFQLTGKTTHGKLLQRMKPTEIKLETVELGFDYRFVNNSSRIFPGDTSIIPLKITNTGSSQNFTLKAIDDLGFITSLVPSDCFVSANKTVEFSLVLQAPSKASPGDTTTIAVYATPTTSDQPSNYMMFYVSVVAKEDDNYPPRCEVVNQTEKCDTIYNLLNCSNVTWNSYIRVLEMGQGLLKITAKNVNIGQLNVENFTEGITNISVTAIYTSTCCHPTANIIAVDVGGNTGSCELSAITQVINIKAATKYNELNLVLNETSKLEFKIRNLGIKGFFSLQASEGKHFTGYVTPLNIYLDHQQEGRGEVVLTGQKETGSNKERFVVKAVPMTKSINVTHVQLFEISLTVKAKKEEMPSLEDKAALRSLVSNSRVIIRAGAKVTVNFTVINVGEDKEFTFTVSSPVSLNCQVTPKSAFLKQNETILGRLTVKASHSTDPGNMQVRVSAVSTAKTEAVIFTLEIVILENITVEDEVKAQEERMGFIKIIGIVLGFVLLLAFTILLVMCFCMRKRGSWTVWKSKSKKSQERVKVEITNPEKSVDKPEMV